MQDIMTKMVDNAINYHLEDLHTLLPAKIIEIDYKTRKISVQPTIKKRKRDGDSEAKGLQDMAIIKNIPLIVPASKFAIVSIPVQVGDEVLIGFFERSVDNYLYSDGSTPVDPQDYRKHDYNDAFAIAGLNTFKNALEMHPEDLVIKMNATLANECTISLKPSGDVVVKSPTKIRMESPIVEAICETALIEASTSVTIDSPQTTCTGELRVDGGVSVGQDVSTDAGFSANNHVHIANLGKPSSKFI